MEEHAVLKNPDAKNDEVKDSRIHDGIPISLRQVANENGLVAKGAHCQSPPQTPILHNQHQSPSLVLSNGSPPPHSPTHTSKNTSNQLKWNMTGVISSFLVLE